MRGTLAQEAKQAMDDARDAHKGVVEAQPSDAEKIAAYQTATSAVMQAANERRPEVVIEYPNFSILRYVGGALVEQGLQVKFDFERCSLTAKWG